MLALIRRVTELCTTAARSHTVGEDVGSAGMAMQTLPSPVMRVSGLAMTIDCAEIGALMEQP